MISRVVLANLILLATAGAIDFATLRSKTPVRVNGITTPAGVSSVLVTAGDKIQTSSAPATVTFRSGTSVTVPGNIHATVSATSVTPTATVASTATTVGCTAAVADCPCCAYQPSFSPYRRGAYRRLGRQ